MGAAKSIRISGSTIVDSFETLFSSVGVALVNVNCLAGQTVSETHCCFLAMMVTFPGVVNIMKKNQCPTLPTDLTVDTRTVHTENIERFPKLHLLR